VRDLVKQRVAHLAWIVQSCKVPGQGDFPDRMVAGTAALTGVVEAEAPVVEGVSS
jgi:hypothetical protein